MIILIVVGVFVVFFWGILEVMLNMWWGFGVEVLIVFSLIVLWSFYDYVLDVVVLLVVGDVEKV